MVKKKVWGANWKKKFLLLSETLDYFPFPTLSFLHDLPILGLYQYSVISLKQKLVYWSKLTIVLNLFIDFHWVEATAGELLVPEVIHKSSSRHTSVLRWYQVILICGVTAGAFCLSGHLRCISCWHLEMIITDLVMLVN